MHLLHGNDSAVMNAYGPLHVTDIILYHLGIIAHAKGEIEAGKRSRTLPSAPAQKAVEQPVDLFPLRYLEAEKIH